MDTMISVVIIAGAWWLWRKIRGPLPPPPPPEDDPGI